MTSRQPLFLTDREVAKALGFGVQKVRRLMEAGQVPGRKYGKVWRTSVAEWSQFLSGSWKREDNAA